jgi:hypothetical protein
MTDIILECNIWCYQNASAEVGDEWVPGSFDMSKICAIKLTTEDPQHFACGMARIYFNDENFTVDVPYDKMVTLWKEFKRTYFFANLQ